MKRVPSGPAVKYLLQSALVGAAYFGVSRWTLAHVFEVSGDVVVPVWPASGLAVAALATGGYRLALGVTFGAVLNGHADFGISATSEAVVGAFLLRTWLRPRRWLSRARDLPALGVAAASSALVGATLGVASMSLSGQMPWSEYGRHWLQFWLGDFMGVVIVAPPLLIAGSWRGRLPGLARLAGSAAITAGLFVLSRLVFDGWVPPETAVSLLGAFFPLVLWMVFRSGRLGASAAILIIAVAAIHGTAQGSGPFAGGAVARDLYHLWIFLAVTTFAAFLLAAVVEEGRWAQRALVESESTLRAFYDSTPANMGLFELRDNDLLFVSGNRSLAEFFGRRPEELANTLLSEYRTGEQLGEWVAHCRDVASSHQAERFEFTRMTEQGKRTLLAVIGPVATEAGEAPRMAFAVQDITEHRAAEVERDRFFEQALDMLCIANFEGCIQRANPAFCRALGYMPDEIGGVSFDALFHPDDLPRARTQLASMAQGRHVASFETRLKKKSGGFFWSLWMGTPDLDHGVIYAIGKDITEQKQVAEALQAAKDAADAATRAKSQFLANVTHELRTPLSGIIGMAGLLKATRLEPSQRDYVEAVAHSANSLLYLVNGLLDFSKLEAHKVRMELEPFSLRSFVGHTVKPLAPQAHEKGLELAYRVPPSVPDALTGDAGRLQQILLNLVGNAIKFTDEGHVVIRVSQEEQLDDRDPRVVVHFQVSDTGIGIPPSKQSEIFQVFVQGDGSTTRKYGGTGLGLAISAQLVELMGGRIWVESEPGKGSTFHFTAPLWVQEEAARTFEESVPASLEGRRVLVVDDVAVTREILGAQLRDWGMEPLSVADTRAALAALEAAENEKRPFELLLLDETPDADVHGFLEQARQGLHAALASIRMSPASAARPIAETPQGMAGRLTKPIQPSHLKKAIALILEGHVLESERQVETGTYDRPPQSRTVSVLVAEDDPVNRGVVVRILESAGHQVRAVDSGRAALEAHERDVFDVILMDLQMLEMDGIEASEIIRSRERGTKRHVPIVAVTAQLREEERERCEDAGMDAFVSKPVDPDRLCELLDRLASGTGAADAASVPGSDPEGVVATHDGANGMEAPAGFDRTELLRRAEGNVGLAADLARMFLEDCPKTMEELDQAVLARDVENSRRLLHRLAGSLETLGARKAALRARSLSEVTRRDGVDWNPPLRALHDEIHRLEAPLLQLTKEGALP